MNTFLKVLKKLCEFGATFFLSFLAALALVTTMNGIAFPFNELHRQDQIQIGGFTMLFFVVLCLLLLGTRMISFSRD